MKKIITTVVAAAFAASSLAALAQDKKKEEVKGKQAGAVTAPSGGAVTTGEAKPAEAKKGGKLPENQGKRKDEKQRTEKK